MIALSIICIVLAALLVIARIELAKSVRLLRQRDATIARTTIALATERAARRALSQDPRTILRAHVASLHR